LNWTNLDVVKFHLRGLGFVEWLDSDADCLVLSPVERGRKDDLAMKRLDSKRLSLLSALTASACCLPPLLLLVFSIGSATAGAALARYHWWFLGVGVVLITISWTMFIRERRACKTDRCARPVNKRLTIASLVFGTMVVGGFAANAVYPYLGLAEKTETKIERAAAQQPTSQVAVIPIEGMTCLTCEAHVEKVLHEVPGVTSADASTANANAVVAFDPAKTSVDVLIQSINTHTGYTATFPEKNP
jgi:copper chaperone CopZ